MWGTSAAGVDLGQADPCIARRQDRRSHTSEVPRRSFSRAGGVAGVCGRSVGTGADVSAPAGPAGRRWHRLVGRLLRSWTCRSETARRGRRAASTEHKVRRSNLFGDQARPPGSRLACPPGAPRGRHRGTRGGQRATHATHRPVTDGVGNAFAMRRPGVRIPAAPPRPTPRLTSANGDIVARVSSMRLASAPLMPPA